MNRKDRRAEEAKTRGGAVLVKAHRSEPMWTKIHAAEAKTVNEMLAGGVDRAKVDAAMDNAIEFAAMFKDETKTNACGDGCFYCCHQRVSTTGIEIVYLATWLRENESDEKRRTILDGLRVVVAQRAPSEDGPVRCPLLSKEGSCGIYEVRPLACRSVTSASSEPCRAWLEEGAALGRNADPRAYTACSAVLGGLDTGAAGRGVQGGYLDFHNALMIALSDDTAIARWYAGEHVFSSATIPPAKRRLLPVL